MRREPLDAEKIVLAAEEVLRRHGPEKATVLDVARALNVSHGSVYRHFPSKAALREAVIRRWLDDARENLDQFANDSSQPPAERLRNLLRSIFAAKRQKAKEDPELFATYRVLAAEHSEVASAHVAELTRVLGDIVASGVASGDFAPVDPAAAAKVIFDATTRFHDPLHAREWLEADIEAESEAVFALIINGLRAR